MRLQGGEEEPDGGRGAEDGEGGEGDLGDAQGLAHAAGGAGGAVVLEGLFIGGKTFYFGA